MPRIYILIVLLCSLISLDLHAQDTIDLRDPRQFLIIGEHISYFEDQAGQLSIADILKADNEGRFISHDREVFSRPGTKSAFWFKVTMQNHTDEDAWLEVGSNYAWYIDFYAPDSTGNFNSPIETGTMRPDENKLYDINYFWLPLNPAGDDQARTYYLRVVSGLTFELPLQIGTIRSLSKAKDTNDFMTAGFIGLVIVMLLYNFFIYFSTKDHIYFYYLGYLFIMAFSMPYANGYPFIENFNFLFFDKTWWNEYFLVWHTPGYFFIGAFCIKYLELKGKLLWLRRLIQVLIIIISGIFPVLNLLGIKFIDLVNPVQVFILILYLTCLISGYYYLIKGQKQANFYVLGWTFLVVGVFVFFGVINGMLPYNFITKNSLYLGAAIEICLFSLALANRLNELRREKESLEFENMRLIKTQNKELEQKVLIRTKQLEEANEELIQSNEELMITSEKLESHSKQLLEINQTKDHLFAIISHDLRSPINSLRGILDLMYRKRISKEEFLKFSIDAKHSVEQAHFMLNNLLTWAKFQMQGMTTKPDEINLRSLIEENMELFRDSSKKKNIMIINHVPDDIKIFADPNHINLVIRNLLSNAIKFTETGEKVTFESIVEDKSCILKISDTGIGIPEDKLTDIFILKPGKSNVGTEGEKGTGLGLPLVKDFVEKNNGTIAVESSLNVGTSFFINLPLYINKVNA